MIEQNLGKLLPLWYQQHLGLSQKSPPTPSTMVVDSGAMSHIAIEREENLPVTVVQQGCCSPRWQHLQSDSHYWFAIPKFSSYSMASLHSTNPHNKFIDQFSKDGWCGVHHSHPSHWVQCHSPREKFFHLKPRSKPVLQGWRRAPLWWYQIHPRLWAWCSTIELIDCCWRHGYRMSGCNRLELWVRVLVWPWQFHNLFLSHHTPLQEYHRCRNEKQRIKSKMERKRKNLMVVWPPLWWARLQCCVCVLWQLQYSEQTSNMDSYWWCDRADQQHWRWLLVAGRAD